MTLLMLSSDQNSTAGMIGLQMQGLQLQSHKLQNTNIPNPNLRFKNLNWELRVKSLEDYNI